MASLSNDRDAVKRAIALLIPSRPGCCADCNFRLKQDERWKNVCSRCYWKRMDAIENEGPSQETSSNTNTEQTGIISPIKQEGVSVNIKLSADANSVKLTLDLPTPSRPGCCADCYVRLTPDEQWKPVCMRCYRKRIAIERAKSKQETKDSGICSKSKTANLIESVPSLCIVCTKPTSKKHHDYCLPCYREQEIIEASQAQKPTQLPNAVQQTPEFYKLPCRDRIRQRRLYVCIDCGTIVPEAWMIQCKVCYAKKPIPKPIVEAVNSEKKRKFHSTQRKKFRRG